MASIGDRSSSAPEGRKSRPQQRLGGISIAADIILRCRQVGISLVRAWDLAVTVSPLPLAIRIAKRSCASAEGDVGIERPIAGL